MGLARNDGAERWEPITSINITPLVDVSLVLVIIFMLTMPFLMEWVVKIIPAQGGAAKAGCAASAILVEMDRGGLLLEGRPTSLIELGPRIKRLRRRRGTSAVALRAARDIPHGEVVSVLDRIADAGVADLDLLQSPEEPHARP
jgi:biopolymer transport protein ExbD